MKRDIDDILHFRTDISPFLVHLTKKTRELEANRALRKIIREKKLKQSGNRVSDACFGINLKTIRNSEEKKDLFGAICFSETPLNEIHSLLDVNRRKVNLQPYGLVFHKRKLTKKNVAPVFLFTTTRQIMQKGFLKLCVLLEKHTYLKLNIYCL